MERHAFRFEGGEYLTTMGASWFVSYTYHLYIDNKHNNWESASNLQSRMSAFSKSKKYYCSFLSEIVKMNANRLQTNSIGLAGFEVKQMAEKVLQKLTNIEHKAPSDLSA